MKIFPKQCLALLIPLLFISCVSKKVEVPVMKTDKLATTPVTPIMKMRAEYIRERVFSKCAASAVFISHQTITLYYGRTDELAERCSILGFTDVLVLFDTQKDSNDLDSFIKSLDNAKINVWLYIDSPSLYSGNEFLTTLLASVNKFRNEHPSLKGLLIYQRPDLIFGPGRRYTSHILYHWDDDSYGKGKDNDLLMKSALDIAEKFRKAFPPEFEIAQMLSPFYDSRIKDGSLVHGSTSDFMKICSKVCIAAYFSDRFQIEENIQTPLQNIKSPASAFVAVRTYVDIYGGADKEKSLSDKSWFKLTKDLESVLKTAGDFKSFRGIAFYDYYGLEKMWEKPETSPTTK
ncbi:MAG: hypothetical protein A2020_05590 [Lentisphaerae bacterium GWF2_45_14]|nr:MAG: hypothetical protein A2020_05590 [Lentisphaerae bacterium GWF2_45_14]